MGIFYPATSKFGQMWSFLQLYRKREEFSANEDSKRTDKKTNTLDQYGESKNSFKVQLMFKRRREWNRIVLSEDIAPNIR